MLLWPTLKSYTDTSLGKQLWPIWKSYTDTSLAKQLWPILKYCTDTSLAKHVWPILKSYTDTSLASIKSHTSSIYQVFRPTNSAFPCYQTRSFGDRKDRKLFGWKRSRRHISFCSLGETQENHKVSLLWHSVTGFYWYTGNLKNPGCSDITTPSFTVHSCRNNMDPYLSLVGFNF